LASGLIQPVGVPADADEKSHRMVYVAQNVGEITNRGWEVQATANMSRLAVTGTMSFVNSRVEKLSNGYTGDLVTGDRMLQVPSRTESIVFAWTARRWTASISGARAVDWINYDALRLTQAASSDQHSARDLSGVRLRDYWRRYDGGMRLRASASRDIREQFALEFSADNLLNHQTGEPDNVTIIPGRTLMTGLRVKF
jgi:iron complex outermembrane recepter protein